jgi:hypothetical protein
MTAVLLSYAFDRLARRLGVSRAALAEMTLQHVARLVRAKNEEADRSIVAASTTAEACT